MAIDIAATNTYCYRCGKSYSRRNGYFAVNYGITYKGVGCLHVCKDCVDTMYEQYLAKCNDTSAAVRQMCRKLDIYWDESAFELLMQKNTPATIMTQYLRQISGKRYIGKSYDDTLAREGTLWNFSQGSVLTEATAETIEVGVDNDVMQFWGPGYNVEMYSKLENRRKYWMTRLPKDVELDIGTETLIKSVCCIELDINRDRAAGKSIEKSVDSLNKLLGSLKLKPVQKRDEIENTYNNTPMGVWIHRFEHEQPIPEIDDDLKDVNCIKKYIFTWMGHLCKMLNIKNGYTKLYEEEIERLRVERPELNDEDDEAFLSSIFSGK